MDSIARGLGNDIPEPSTAQQQIIQILSKSMDSRARRGSDASKQAPRITKSFKVRSTTMLDSSYYLLLVLFFSCPLPLISSSCYVCAIAIVPLARFVVLSSGCFFLLFSCRLNIMDIHELDEEAP